MRELTLHEMREVQLNILRHVDDFCREHRLRYSLGGGTLLGAVRHGGYIPWDDDIDLMMPRPDYDLFIEKFRGSSDRYICGCYENDENYQHPFAKIYDNRTILKEEGIVDELSVNIDLFPVDGLPSEGAQIKRHVRRVYRAWRWVRRRNREIVRGQHSMLQRLTVHYIRRFSKARLQERVKTLCLMHDYASSEMAGAIVGVYGMREVYQRSLFEEYIDLPFEGMMLRAIADYDSYLSQHYGDYMSLPPVEQQVRRHTVTAYTKGDD